tara:strand:- start:29829 stop:30632 length:804 start_codon:yes stop_codon:yes gene_type:complete
MKQNKILNRNVEIHSNNWAVMALLKKEISRFGKVWIQTILAPVISSLLFLIIFSYLLNNRLEPFPGISYSAFLVPGLVMMTIQQNAFANTSSSFTQSKITGNLVFLMLSPMTPIQWFFGYLGGAIIRGIACGLTLWIFCTFIVQINVEHLAWIIVFSFLSCIIMGGLGLIAGIYAEKWDQVAGFQNFLINPLTLLAGVFFSTNNLPPFWQTLSKFNPFFYLIDGFRYGVFGTSDISPWLSFFISISAGIAISIICLKIIGSGWRLKT